MRYLGAPIAARRTIKPKSAKFRVKEMEIFVRKIMSSLSHTVQKIDVVKTLLLLSIGFLLLNGEIGRLQLRNIDKKIREMINRDLKVKEPPIECHHASWKNRDLSYPSLRERGDVLTIRSFT
jgi:hypothetical protein